MAVRNIARGYIGGGQPTSSSSATVSTLYNKSLVITGAFTGTYNVVFNKIGRIIVLTLPSIMEVPSSTSTPTTTLPDGYE